MMVMFFFKNGTRYFRICWRDTWEPEDHLINCQDILNNFLKSRESGAQAQPEVKGYSFHIDEFQYYKHLVLNFLDFCLLP